MKKSKTVYGLSLVNSMSNIVQCNASVARNIKSFKDSHILLDTCASESIFYNKNLFKYIV